MYFMEAQIDEMKKDEKLSKFINADRLEQFRSFGGVRIEDVVVVRKDGIENFTQTPRSIEEVRLPAPWAHLRAFSLQLLTFRPLTPFFLCCRLSPSWQAAPGPRQRTTCPRCAASLRSGRPPRSSNLRAPRQNSG